MPAMPRTIGGTPTAIAMMSPWVNCIFASVAAAGVGLDWFREGYFVWLWGRADVGMLVAKAGVG